MKFQSLSAHPSQRSEGKLTDPALSSAWCVFHQGWMLWKHRRFLGHCRVPAHCRLAPVALLGPASACPEVCTSPCGSLSRSAAHLPNGAICSTLRLPWGEFPSLPQGARCPASPRRSGRCVILSPLCWRWILWSTSLITMESSVRLSKTIALMGHLKIRGCL